MDTEMNRKLINVIKQIVDRVEKDLPMFVTIIFDNGEDTVVVSGNKDTSIAPTLIGLSDLQNKLIHTFFEAESVEDA